MHVEVTGILAACDACTPLFVTKPPVILTPLEANDPLPPSRFALRENFPNPFNPATQIEYEIHAAGAAEFAVYDLLGRSVALLVSAMQAAGTHRVGWSADGVPAGVYIARITYTSPGIRGEQSRPMVLLR